MVPQNAAAAVNTILREAVMLLLLAEMSFFLFKYEHSVLSVWPDTDCASEWCHHMLTRFVLLILFKWH